MRTPVSVTVSPKVAISPKVGRMPISPNGGVGADAKRRNKDVDPPKWAAVCDKPWVLQRVAGRGPELIHIFGRSHLTLGRSSKANEQLQSHTCSGMHAIIAFRRGNDGDGEEGEGESDRLCLRDLDSMHGTFVDGVKVTSDSWTVVGEGNVVTFGDKNAPEETDYARYKLCRERPEGEAGRNKGRRETEASGAVPEAKSGVGKSGVASFGPSPALQKILEGDLAQAGDAKAKHNGAKKQRSKRKG